MKTILLLFVTSVTFAQTNLIIDSNTTIGQNCGQGQPNQILTVQDLNFNGDFEISLKGVDLVILGNQNGNGTITNFCNNNASTICIAGNQNGNITLDGVSLVNCTLSTPLFNPVINQDLQYKIYDLNGRLLASGKTNANMYETLSKGVYLVEVDGFKIFKKAVN